MNSINNFSDLLIALGALAGLGVVLGVGARIAMPGNQHMGPAKTVLYGAAGAIIGGGLALVLDQNYFFVAFAGALVTVLLIGVVHQGGVLIPEDAPAILDPDSHATPPTPQGGDLLDFVTRNHHGDEDRALDAAEERHMEAVHDAHAHVLDEGVVVGAPVIEPITDAEMARAIEAPEGDVVADAPAETPMAVDAVEADAVIVDTPAEPDATVEDRPEGGPPIL